MSNENRTHENGQAQGWAIGMAIVAGLVRLIAQPFHFTPINALGLFGGARLRSWLAYVLPLLVMAASDLLLWTIRGRHDYSLLKYAFNPWVYGCFLMAVLWGRLLLRNAGAGRVALVSIAVSVQFFLVTNFGVWYADSVAPATLPDGTSVTFENNPNFPAPIPTHYSRNVSGLIACYVAALPFTGSNAPPLGFLGNQLVGDLFYTAVLFGVFALLRGRVTGMSRLRQPVAARTP